MLAFDHEPLRVRLAADVALLTSGVNDAAEVKKIFAQLADTTMTILRDLAYAWSEVHDLLRHLPKEVLALCFTFLPFSDRITASHVSRHWRAVSLADPAIWTDIDMPRTVSRNWSRILRMALSRTRRYPVDVQGLSIPDQDGIFQACMLEHMHHLRLLDWNFPEHSVSLTARAPLLETLRGINYHVDIPSDFLGGQPAQLRTLYISSASLPETCPTLSTLTRLILDMPHDLNLAATLCRLFVLCPNLQTLRLGDLLPPSRFQNFFPRGPAPPSLVTLDLSSARADCDLAPLYIAWRTNNLRNVSLEQRCKSPASLEALVSGARSLTVMEGGSPGQITITACYPSGRTHSITFRDGVVDGRLAATMISNLRSHLERIRTVEVSDTYIDSFPPVLAGLPKLRQVTLIWELSPYRASDGGDTHAFISFEEQLCDLAEHCPNLDSIHVRAYCKRESCPLTSADAQAILADIADLGDRELPDIHIEGFSSDLVAGVEVPAFEGFLVQFST
ncbi:hypothetical protein AURDEDRAFT_164448 [Auricularia subglabra TFB-10046 SS5]|nr:hypothetical protein AURDEDRAFT_164448 [Auricularia subglabra TFB-10046 SS5]